MQRATKGWKWARLEDARTRLLRGDAQRNLAVEAPRAAQRRVQRVRPVRRAWPRQADQAASLSSAPNTTPRSVRYLHGAHN